VTSPDGTENQQPGHDTGQSRNSKHHSEKAVIIAFASITVVMLLGFLLASCVSSLMKPESGPSDVREYNGFEFTRSGNFWITEWKRVDGSEYSLEFRNAPWEVDGIEVEGETDTRFSQWPYVFITHDPSDETTRSTAFVAISASNLASVLTAVFEREVIGACTRNFTEGCSTRPITTCSTNASVIYLMVSNETGISLDGNCAIIRGFGENLTKAADKAVYQWLGIVKK